MLELLRTLVLHQAKIHRTLVENWGPDPDLPRTDAGEIGRLLDGMVHDGLWLSKFPVHYTPVYDVTRLDTLNKAWQAAPGAGLSAAAAEVRHLRPRLDADLLRFLLSLKPEDLKARVEIFFGGRAMNKPLWQYLVTWFEHGAVLRGRMGPAPRMTDTVFD